MSVNIPFKAGLFAIAIAGLPAVSVAQDEGKQGPEAEEELIVTGVAQPTSKLDSSSSVTALPAEDIQNFAPRSTAEIFRNLPGIQAEATGGDANANIKVRGLPISAGGTRYLSIQEDGLPVLLIGDMDFATADSFLRFDSTVRSVQSVRGGTGATLGSNSPGGIINFVSNTGEEEGGSVSYTTGLDYDSNRLDLAYGRPLDGGWRYHVGGYYRDGEGPREVPGDIEKGYQIKGNVTRELDNGYFRVSVKQLDDRSPTYLPVPARYKGNGEYEEVGVDFGDGTVYLQGTDTIVREGGYENTSLATGFESNVTSVGFEGTLDITDTTTFGFNHRYSSISGAFVSPFPAQVYENADGVAARIHYFNTRIDSLDNTMTDLNVTQDFGTFDLRAGVFRGVQDYVLQRGWNTYFVQLDGNYTPVAGPSGEPSFVPGHAFWGECCQNTYDFEIENIAPYAALTGSLGERFNWDASVRRDRWSADGNYANTGSADANGYNTFGPGRPINFTIDYTSWSLGGNFSLTDSTALFANVSKGGSMSSPSRILGSVQANGDIDAPESAFNVVEQRELGFKYRGDNSSVYVTLFDTDTTEAAGFEVTTQKVIENTYASSGIEIEGDVFFDNGFSIKGSVTLTDAEIVKSNVAANEGNTPRRQADTIFNITPSYTHGGFTAGLNIIGTDEVYVSDANDATLDGYIVANLFLVHAFDEQTTISLNINNLFDEVGFTEGEDGSAVDGDLVRVRPINGRTASINLRYNF